MPAHAMPTTTLPPAARAPPRRAIIEPNGVANAARPAAPFNSERRLRTNLDALDDVRLSVFMFLLPEVFGSSDGRRVGKTYQLALTCQQTAVYSLLKWPKYPAHRTRTERKFDEPSRESANSDR